MMHVQGSNNSTVRASSPCASAICASGVQPLACMFGFGACMVGVFTYVCAVLLTLQIVAKLASLDIQGCKTIRVQTSGAEGGWFFDVDPNDQPQALRHALAQLRPHIQTRGNELVLWGFTMSPELAAELTAVTAAAQWGRVSLQSTKWPDGFALAAPLPPLHTLGI